MAEESDLEKTEPASPRRLEKAREEGNVARSRELVTFVLLATAVAGLWALSGPLGRDFQASFSHGLRFERAAAFDTSFMLTQADQQALSEFDRDKYIMPRETPSSCAGSTRADFGTQLLQRYRSTTRRRKSGQRSQWPLPRVRVAQMQIRLG